MLLRVVLAMVVVAVVVVAAAPARAQSGSWADAARDAGPLPFLDLTSVAVKNTSKSIRVTYSSLSRGNRNGTEAVLLDTDPRRPGPELQVGFGRYSESWVTPMRNWRPDRSSAAKKRWNPNPFGAPRRCDKTVRISTNWRGGFTPTTLTVRKKKGCITTKRVRVRISTATDGYTDHVRSDVFGSTLLDSLPNGARTFTRWVRQRPAKAAAVRFADGAGAQAWWSDIRKVDVNHGWTASTVTVHHGPRPVYRQGSVTMYFDTDLDGVPNYVIDVGAGAPVLRAATAWGPSGPPIACRVDGQLAPVGLSTTTVAAQRGCLGDPGQFRVAAVLQDTTSTAYRPTDWWLGPRTWSPVLDWD